MRIEVLDEAEADLIEGFHFYEGQEAGLGSYLGGIASVAVANLLSAGLVGLGSPNPTAYLIVPLSLLLLTIAACYIPSRRAASIDLLRAIRHE